ncbi:MAG TPA: hypothetical protein VFY06_14540 [Verrucomicrobiae bacterium]|nr:hypothetical protein [Verrucomicrobiae bacterium]
MKTASLITIGAVALTAITFNVAASDTLLSPRAAGNQIQSAAGMANGVALAAAGTATLAPRTAGNQIKTVAGTANDVNPAAVCAWNMPGTPKAVQACVEHATMPGCMSPMVASVK